MDQRLHSEIDVLLLGQDDFSLVYLDRPFRQVVHCLLDDPRALNQLFHPDEIPVICIAVFSNRNVEIVVAKVEEGLRFPDVVIDPCSAEHRTSHVPVDCILGGDHANPLRSIDPDPVPR